MVQHLYPECIWYLFQWSNVYDPNAIAVYQLTAVINIVSHTYSAHILTWINSILYIVNGGLVGLYVYGYNCSYTKHTHLDDAHGLA
jgi:hypothetical protein